ncbi:MAG: invasion associated locus B family protein [Xanthobacteraceae bacterium]
MKYWIAPARPVGRALAATATALSVLIVVAANAQTPAPGQKPPATKPPAAKPPAAQAAPAAKPPAAAPAPQQAAAPPQGQQIQLLYSPWTKFCAKGKEADAKQVCLTGKDGRVETGQPVVSAVLIQPEGGPSVLRVTLPLTVQLQRGTRVMVDQTKLASMQSDTQSTPYTICFVNGCMADFQATPDVINQLKKGQSLWVQGFSIAGEFINLPLPLEEFGKTLDGPPTDPKVIEEQQKKMQDELQKRAEAVKKQLESQQGGAAQPAK